MSYLSVVPSGTRELEDLVCEGWPQEDANSQVFPLSPHVGKVGFDSLRSALRCWRETQRGIEAHRHRKGVGGVWAEL